MVATTLKAAVAARIKNNVVRGLGAACGGRADLLRAIPSEDDHVFSKTPGETTKTPGDTLAPSLGSASETDTLGLPNFIASAS